MHVVELDRIKISCSSSHHLLETIKDFQRDTSDRVLVGFYASLLYRANRDEQYRSDLSRADVIYPDGKGVQWYCMAHTPLNTKTERVATTDMWDPILSHCIADDIPIVLVGGREHIVEEVRRKCESIGAKIVYAKSGYFEHSDRLAIMMNIRQYEGATVFLGLGAGVQERFAVEMIDEIPDRGQTILTVGGLFDHVCGQSVRAPRIVQAIGFEWMWRTVQEPQRLAKRYLVGNAYFVYRALRYRTQRLLRN